MRAISDTIAALATPAGTAAIALLRVTGPDTQALARVIFGGAPPPRTVRHGDYRDRLDRVVDDVLWVFFQAPHSYTGEDSLEISCHGNPLIVQKILEDLLARGARAAGPGEFTQRAFLNGRMDLSQAEAVMDVIHARSERALAAANLQLRGALGRHMSALVDALLAVLAKVEAYIDFPDEGLPPEDHNFIANEIDRMLLEADRLIATNRHGNLLRDGLKAVIIGEPNAGKSSLFNRMVGRDRALVCPEAGTTRDFIEERVSVGPHFLRLIDTAGLNALPGPIEKLGIGKTLECIGDSDLVIIVSDATGLALVLPPAIETMLSSKPAIRILNKIDLLPNGAAHPGLASQAGLVRTSAVTGAGLAEFEAEIVRQADACLPPCDDEVIAINARHSQALTAACECLREARQKVTISLPAELLASDLRGALSAFGEIFGRIDNERILDQLFADFCIGK